MPDARFESYELVRDFKALCAVKNDLCKRVVDQNLEIDQLKASVKHWESEVEAYADEAGAAVELRVEIDRLKAELDKAWRAATDQGDETSRLRNVIETHIATIRAAAKEQA